MTRRRWIPNGNRVVLILLGIACGMAILLFSLRAVARRVFGPGPVPARSLEHVTGLTKVVFPPGSTLIDGEVSRSWHSHAFARVTIPPERVSEFWQQPYFESLPVTRFDPQAFQGMIGVQLWNEWRLWRVQDGRYNQGGEFDHGGALEALISLDDPANPVLYLYWWTG